MAFATSNARRFVNPKIYVGDWTGSVGDASGTVTLTGTQVYLVLFFNHDADSPKEIVPTDVSVSGSTITITVHNHMDVTTGKFIVFFA